VVRDTLLVEQLQPGLRSVACQSRSPSRECGAQLAFCIVAEAPMCPRLVPVQGRRWTCCSVP
jgi:hypothetical protein